MAENEYVSPQQQAEVTTAPPVNEAPKPEPKKAAGKIENISIDLADNGGVIVNCYKRAPESEGASGMAVSMGKSEKQVFEDPRRAILHVAELLGIALGGGPGSDY